MSLDTARHIIIIGGPETGKTTLSEKLSRELNISTVRHTDDLIDLGWSQASEKASWWLDSKDSWIVEGAAAVRALRKYLARNAGAPCDFELIYLDRPYTPLSKGQETMRKGVATVWNEIKREFTIRGGSLITA
jgi:adenylate kinase family enzyme